MQTAPEGGAAPKSAKHLGEAIPLLQCTDGD